MLPLLRRSCVLLPFTTFMLTGCTIANYNQHCSSWEKLLVMAETACARRDYEQSSILFAKACDEASTLDTGAPNKLRTAFVLARQGYVREQLHNFSGAQSDYRRACEIFADCYNQEPESMVDFATTCNRLGKLLIQEGRKPEALSVLEHGGRLMAIKWTPGADKLLAVEFSLNLLLRSELVVVPAERKRLREQSVIVSGRSGTEGMLRALDESKPRSTAVSWSSLVSRSEAVMKSGKPQDAEKDLLEALRIATAEPTRNVFRLAYTHDCLCRCMLLQKRILQAQKHGLAVLKILRQAGMQNDPMTGRALFYLAVLKSAKGYDAAVVDCKRAILALRSQESPVAATMIRQMYDLLAQMAESAGRRADAIGYLEQSMSGDIGKSADPESLLKLAGMRMEEGRSLASARQATAARKAFAAAAAVLNRIEQPPTSAVYAMKAESLGYCGDIKRAEDLWRKSELAAGADLSALTDLRRNQLNAASRLPDERRELRLFLFERCSDAARLLPFTYYAPQAMNIADAYENLRQFDRGERVLQGAIEAARIGQDDRSVLYCELLHKYASNLIWHAEKIGESPAVRRIKLAEADRCLRLSREIRKHVMGRDTPQFVAIDLTSGFLEYNLGHYADSLRFFNNAIEGSKSCTSCPASFGSEAVRGKELAQRRLRD